MNNRKENEFEIMSPQEFRGYNKVNYSIRPSILIKIEKKLALLQGFTPRPSTLFNNPPLEEGERKKIVEELKALVESAQSSNISPDRKKGLPELLSQIKRTLGEEQSLETKQEAKEEIKIMSVEKFKELTHLDFEVRLGTIKQIDVLLKALNSGLFPSADRPRKLGELKDLIKEAIHYSQTGEKPKPKTFLGEVFGFFRSGIEVSAGRKAGLEKLLSQVEEEIKRKPDKAARL